ncbi:MAG: hypothetical protein Q9205_008074, partial [Flavoplaca limonia]
DTAGHIPPLSFAGGLDRMTERRRRDMSPPPRRRSGIPIRKRVPFATQNAASRATLLRNATTPPLLRLPPEIRDKIWTEVLGGRLVHLMYRYFEHQMDFDDFDRYYELTFKRSPRRHIVCEDDGPEDRAKEKSVPNPRYYKAIHGAPARWVYPHDACNLNYEDPGSSIPIIYRAHEGMRLTVLRVSRQLYAEANPVLWTTNIYSFGDGPSLQRFMDTRTMNQKRLIRT